MSDKQKPSKSKKAIKVSQARKPTEKKADGAPDSSAAIRNFSIGLGVCCITIVLVVITLTNLEKVKRAFVEVSVQFTKIIPKQTSSQTAAKTIPETTPKNEEQTQTVSVPTSVSQSPEYKGPKKGKILNEEWQITDDGKPPTDEGEWYSVEEPAPEPPKPVNKRRIEF